MPIMQAKWLDAFMGFFSLIFQIDANAFSYRALASIEFAAVVLL